jgi:SAM-dependent methyltransferase
MAPPILKKALNRSLAFEREALSTLELPGGPIPVFSTRDAYVANYERIASDHLFHMAQTGANPFISEHLWRDSEALTAGLVRKYSVPGARILDVGCGLARLLEQFRELERYGMDISPDYLEHAQRKGVDVCLARVEDMPYRDGFFDVVVCTDVLEHVFDLDLAVRQILRVVRDGGVVVVRVPYREDLAYYRSGSPYEYVHLRNFDEDELYMLFEKIHDCSVPETLKGPYDLRQSRPKCHRLGGRPLRLGLRALGLLARGLGAGVARRYLEWMFDPVVINVVVRVRRT